MEELLHYVWKHKIFLLRELKTTDGRTVEVINPGMHNTDAGPDFNDAKVKIDGVLWVGNVEIHQHASDWFKHHHDSNAAYDDIILHVVADADTTLKYQNGIDIPQLQIEVPVFVRNNFDTLVQSDVTPRCANVISNISKIKIHSWLSALQVERLEMRTQQILERRDLLDKNWEDTLFVTIARNFGFGKNGDAFETWAHSIPMSAVGKHRDNLFQIEAIFFGQAGLLETNTNEENISRVAVKSAESNEYFCLLQREYKYLRQKFSLTPINARAWKFLRLRPQNFPHIRIAQLAMLYYKQQLNISKLINASTIEDIRSILQSQVSNYWRTHYTFSSDESSDSDKRLSKPSLDLLIINSVTPILFAYGRYKADDKLCEKAVNLWECTKPENNRIILNWKNAGVVAENAADTQALIQLTQKYCNRRDCLRCRFGYEYMSRCPDFLREEKGEGDAE